MRKYALLTYSLATLLALLTAYVVIHSWSLRHPTLVFFGNSTNMLARYVSNSLLFLVLFLVQHFFIVQITHHLENKKRLLYLALDQSTYLLLASALLFRDTIDSRSMGNQFYFLLFLFWGGLKCIFIKSIWDLKKAQTRLRINALITHMQTAFKTRFERAKEIDSHFLLGLAVFFFLIFCLKPEKANTWIYCLSLSETFLLIGLLWALRTLWIFLFGTLKIFSFYLLCLLYLLFHTLDMVSLKLVNLHVWDTYHTLFSEGFLAAKAFLEGADLNPTLCLLTFIGALSLPLIASFFFQRHRDKRLTFSFALPFLFLGLSLIQNWTVETQFTRRLSYFELKQVHFALHPFCLFLKPKSETLLFPSYLKPPPSPSYFDEQLEKIPPSNKKQPHIFLFVIESYRKDFLNEKTSPFVFEFSKSCPNFLKTASNSNVTHCSLFSLFHSQYPHHWMKVRDQSKTSGAFPLRVLKKRGYELNAFHSSFFKYFDIGESIFGLEHALLKVNFEAKHLDSEVANRDVLVKEQVKKWILSESFEQPQFTTILLDSTHHHYYWPENFEVPFHPYQKSFSYTSRSSKQLEWTKNRYLNAVYFVDSLVREIIEEIQKKGIFDDSLIVITGDHGEEFMENGHYFHGTDLCFEQSNVPIYYKFPKSFSKQVQKELTSHVDFFPTLFDGLGILIQPEALAGSSIFANKNQFIISFKPRHKKDPNQFYFFSGGKKVELELNEPSSIYSSKGVILKAFKDAEENMLDLESSSIMPELIRPLEKELFE